MPRPGLMVTVLAPETDHLIVAFSLRTMFDGLIVNSFITGGTVVVTAVVVGDTVDVSTVIVTDFFTVEYALSAVSV